MIDPKVKSRRERGGIACVYCINCKGILAHELGKVNIGNPQSLRILTFFTVRPLFAAKGDLPSESPWFLKRVLGIP